MRASGNTAVGMLASSASGNKSRKAAPRSVPVDKLTSANRIFSSSSLLVPRSTMPASETTLIKTVAAIINSSTMGLVNLELKRYKFVY